MADIVTTSKNLTFQMNYNDKDTRSATVPDARNYTSADSETVMTALNAFGAITIGDKNGGTFSDTSNARIIDTRDVNIDLTSE